MGSDRPAAADTTPAAAPSGLTSSTAVGRRSRPRLAGGERHRGGRPLQRPPLGRPGFTPSTANRIGQTDPTSYADSGLAAGTYYYRVAAEDAAGNASAPTSVASAQSPTRRRRPRPARSPRRVRRTLRASRGRPRPTSRRDGRRRAPRRRSSGFTPSAANRVIRTTQTTYRDDRTGRRGPTTTKWSPSTPPGMRARRRTRRAQPSRRPRIRSAPSAPGTLAASAAASAVDLSLAARHRQRRRDRLQRPPRDDRRFHAERREPARAADRHDV